MALKVRELQKLRKETWELERLIALLIEARDACKGRYGTELRVLVYPSGNMSICGSEGEKLMYLYLDQQAGRAMLRPHNSEITGNVHPVRAYTRKPEDNEDDNSESIYDEE